MVRDKISKKIGNLNRALITMKLCGEMVLIELDPIVCCELESIQLTGAVYCSVNEWRKSIEIRLRMRKWNWNQTKRWTGEMAKMKTEENGLINLDVVVLHGSFLTSLTCSSDSIVSGITSGFFSSLSLPSISLLVALLSLGPGEAARTVVPCARTKSFRLLRPHAHRRINTIVQLPITNKMAKPMANEKYGVNWISGERGCSTVKEEETEKHMCKMKWVSNITGS